MTDRQLSALRTRLQAAGHPDGAAAVDALAVALQALGELAADEGLPRPVRRRAGRAWALIRWGGAVPTPFTVRDDAPAWGNIFDDDDPEPPGPACPRCGSALPPGAEPTACPYCRL